MMTPSGLVIKLMWPHLIMLTMNAIKRILHGVGILAMMFSVQLVSASEGIENYLISQSYYEDLTNQLNLDQVKLKSFSPYQNILTKGYSHSTYWIRLTIKGSQLAGANDALILRLRPSYTDEIELFDPSDQTRQSKRRLTGDMYAWSNDEYQSLNLNFKIKKDLVDRDIYLRIKSVHTYLLHADAFDIKHAELSDKKIELIYLFYLAFLLVLAVWIVTTWILNREMVLGLFSLTQLVAVFYAASMFGFMRVIFDQVLSAHVLNDLTSYLIVGYVAISLLAHSSLLNEYGLKTPFKWGLRVFIAMPIISGICIGAGLVTEGLQLNATSLLAASIFLPLTTFFGFLPSSFSQEKSLLPKFVVRIYYILLLVILAITLLPMMGIIRAIEFTLHALFIHGLLSGLLLFALLQYRVKRINQFQMKKIVFESSKAEQERIRREDQGQLIGMLTHEIKNSLAVVDLAVSSIADKFKDNSFAADKDLIRVSKAIDDINLVIARCIDVDRMDQERIHISAKNINLAIFLKEIALEVEGSSRLRWDCREPIVVECDPDLLKVVVINLIDNALKYAKDGSIIHIHAVSNEEGRSIVIKNEVGYVGLPDDSKVFEKYYRSEKAQKNRGTGLGLWLSRSIVRLMNADLIYSSDGEVITFLIVWAGHAK